MSGCSIRILQGDRCMCSVRIAERGPARVSFAASPSAFSSPPSSFGPLLARPASVAAFCATFASDRLLRHPVHPLFLPIVLPIPVCCHCASQAASCHHATPRHPTFYASISVRFSSNVPPRRPAVPPSAALSSSLCALCSCIRAPFFCLGPLVVLSAAASVRSVTHLRRLPVPSPSTLPWRSWAPWTRPRASGRRIVRPRPILQLAPTGSAGP